MAFTNFETREIHCKVVYFGPGGAGKTINLKSIYSTTATELKSGMVDMTGPGGPTPFFDFLPVSIGTIKNHHVKLHLYTMPSHPLYETLLHTMLKGVDAFVFVADSRMEAMADNLDAMTNVRHLLTDHGYSFPDVPRVIQYNKRDMEQLMPVDILREELNPAGFPDHEAIATRSIGTLETLQSVARQIVSTLSIPGA
jgi:signal recognition particle receptor subunit beta